jgi:hypothetical protein
MRLVLNTTQRLFEDQLSQDSHSGELISSLR